MVTLVLRDLIESRALEIELKGFESVPFSLEEPRPKET